MRAILVIHRYLGVAIGLVMALWCLSGFVMMYHHYPALSPAQRLKALEPLDLEGCCERAAAALAGSGPVSSFRVQMLAGRPVLRLEPVTGAPEVIDLRSGARIAGVGTETALAVARDYAAGNGVGGKPHNLGLIGLDQWTVEDAAGHGPLHHLGFGDPFGQEIYVSAATGEVVQQTTRSERVWAWFGAIPHWLYPVVLRRHVALWSGIVIWAALIGVFLTVTGLYVGISRVRRYKSGRWSPYRGWFYWHHVAGLAFGVLALAWVGSGFLTMTPWGLLDSAAGPAERAQLAGAMTGGDIARLLAAEVAAAPRGVVEIKGAPLGGKLFAMAVGPDGRALRIDADARPSPLRLGEVMGALVGMGGAPVGSLVRLDREDAYYYGGYDGPVALPVYRARLKDRGGSAYYIDAASGRLILAVDGTARQSRWLRTGLHDWDFAWVRARPVWDIVVILLLSGVTALVSIGAWIGLKRLWRDLATLGRSWARRSP
jgi:hypothetical protein